MLPPERLVITSAAYAGQQIFLLVMLNASKQHNSEWAGRSIMCLSTTASI